MRLFELRIFLCIQFFEGLFLLLGHIDAVAVRIVKMQFFRTVIPVACRSGQRGFLRIRFRFVLTQHGIHFQHAIAAGTALLCKFLQIRKLLLFQRALGHIQKLIGDPALCEQKSALVFISLDADG